MYKCRIDKERSRRRTLLLVLSALVFLIGCGLLAYPRVANWLSNRNQSELITDYNSAIEEMDNSDAEDELKRAEEYNLDLADMVKLVEDPFVDDPGDKTEYNSLLNATDAGIMGYVEIPKIDVFLPIYHGVGSDILTKGIGHLPETSLPVGGESTHCVLAGHSGMSNARLFTDLTKLNEGDEFIIHVYNRDLYYTVDQIKKVAPTDTTDLQIVDGEDYVTLVTCVPVWVNSHRLLVRGKRLDNDAA